jgi:FkbM family methyltransferase
MLLKNIGRVFFRGVLFFRARKYLKSNPPIFGGLFDYISFEILLDDVYEKAELNLFINWLHHMEIKCSRKFLNLVIDVGSNIGNHARFFSRFADSVIALEAHPLTFKLLEVNSSEFPNIHPINLGVSDAEKILFMPPLGSNIGGLALQSTQTRYSVRCDKLDNILKNESDVGIVKIDVEGHELQVLTGARDLIQRDFPIILFEQQNAEIVNGSTPCIDLLKSYGYKNFLYFDKNGAEPKSGMTSMFVRVFKIIIYGDQCQLRAFDVLPARYHPMVIAYS